MLKLVLSLVSSDAQSAFVPGRLIIDKIIVGFKVLNSLKSKCNGQKGSMVVKLDMSNAYDRVDWCFLEKIMQKLGFDAKWVALVMECVSTPSFSVLLNGEPHGFVSPSRGIRQGDPLSPYLFLFCAEGFTTLLRQAEQDKRLSGVSICLPALIGRSKENSFKELKERIAKKLNEWSERLLSKAGRESKMGNKIHWNKWRKLCSLKENGGIGFRDFHFFNLAMLVKQGWRLTNNNSSLVHRVYKAKSSGFPLLQYASKQTFVVAVKDLIDEDRRRLLLILKEEELEEWAATAWSLWNARIRFLHEGFQAHPECIVEKGATLIRDYQWMQISLLRASVTASPTLN
uniref:Reverse transcriptase domain-containing protein n=1 Tax=Fagus sylvatica TaxID=28930 RepID=A0A2N9HJ10_FAGSY